MEVGLRFGTDSTSSKHPTFFSTEQSRAFALSLLPFSWACDISDLWIHYDARRRSLHFLKSVLMAILWHQLLVVLLRPAEYWSLFLLLWGFLVVFCNFFVSDLSFRQQVRLDWQWIQSGTIPWGLISCHCVHFLEPRWRTTLRSCLSFL